MKSVILSILAGLACQAAPIALTDTKGRTITVEVVAVADGTVIVRKTDGGEVQIPLENLSAESRAAATHAAATPAPVASATVGAASGLKLTSVSRLSERLPDSS